MNYVLDASVVLKWFLSEKESKKALQLRNDAFNHKLTLHTTELLFFETSNVLRLKTIPLPDKQEVMYDLYATPFTIHTFGVVLMEASLELAQEYDITVYDASYIALAKQCDSTFLTSDKKLKERTKTLGFVQLFSA